MSTKKRNKGKGKGGGKGKKKDDQKDPDSPTAEIIVEESESMPADGPPGGDALEMKEDGSATATSPEDDFAIDGPPAWTLTGWEAPGGLFACCGGAGPPASDMLGKVKTGTLEPEVTGVPTDKGYDPQLFENPLETELFICVYCSFVLRDGQEAECGHCLCKVCFETLKEDNNLICPDCEDPIVEAEMQASRMAKRVLKKALVMCNRAAMSDDEKAEDCCPWTGVLPKLEEHIETCDFQYATCPFGCQTDGIGTGAMTQEGHYDGCPEFPILCKWCDEYYARRLEKLHLDGDGEPKELSDAGEPIGYEGCELKELKCRLGCGKMIVRKEMMDHIKDNVLLHIQLVEKKFKEEFLTMDADGSGKTDFEEFKNHMTKIGLQLDDKKARKMFDQIDADNSGEIDQKEFNAVLRASSKIIQKYPDDSPASVLKKVFEAIASNGKGIE